VDGNLVASVVVWAAALNLSSLHPPPPLLSPEAEAVAVECEAALAIVAEEEGSETEEEIEEGSEVVAGALEDEMEGLATAAVEVASVADVEVASEVGATTSEDPHHEAEDSGAAVEGLDTKAEEDSMMGLLPTSMEGRRGRAVPVVRGMDPRVEGLVVTLDTAHQAEEEEDSGEAVGTGATSNAKALAGMKIGMRNDHGTRRYRMSRRAWLTKGDSAVFCFHAQADGRCKFGACSGLAPVCFKLVVFRFFS